MMFLGFFQLVSQNLINVVDVEFKNENQSVVRQLVAIHIVHIKVLPRLRNFASIIRVWPECSTRIVEFQETKSQERKSQLNLDTNEEMVSYCFSRLHYILSVLFVKFRNLPCTKKLYISFQSKIGQKFFLNS